MLAKLPCVPRTPTSRSLLIPCEDSDGDAVAFGNTAPMSAPCPCKVVIGFDVGSESKRLAHVCESPRSVLEMAAALPSQEKRSPRSALGSLLAAKTRSDEDGAVVYSTITCSPVAGKCLLPPACEFCEESKVGMIHHNASGLQTVPCQCDFSGDFSACDEQGLHLLPQEDLKDELFDADIRPLQVAENGSLLENDEAKNVLNSTPPSQTLSFLLGNLVKVDEMVATECKRRDETADTKSYRCLHNGVPSKEPIREGMAVPDPAFLLDSSPEHFCRRSIVNDGNNGPQRIFVASPPYRPRSYGMMTSGFLKSCNFCSCFLNHGRDIFMYRGDQTFCSAECRYQKILLDDSKNSKSLNISKVALVTEKIEADLFKSCLDSAR